MRIVYTDCEDRESSNEDILDRALAKYDNDEYDHGPEDGSGKDREWDKPWHPGHGKKDLSCSALVRNTLRDLGLSEPTFWRDKDKGVKSALGSSGAW